MVGKPCLPTESLDRLALPEESHKASMGSYDRILGNRSLLSAAMNIILYFSAQHSTGAKQVWAIFLQ